MSEHPLTQEAPTGNELPVDRDEQVTQDEQTGTELPSGDEAQSAESSDDTAQRELASSRGWVEKEKYKGKAAWADAETYNARYESIMPVVTRENKRLRDELKELRDRDAQRDRQISELTKFQQEQNEARAKIQHQTLLAERAAAIENNDTQRIVQIDDQLMDMKLAARGAPPQKPTQPQFDPNLKRIEEDFIADNPVFREPEMYEALTEAALLARGAGSQLQGREFLDKLKSKVERWYPDKFTVQRRPAMVETGGTPGRQSMNGRSWNDLKPDEAAKQEEFIRTAFPKMDAKGLKNVRSQLLAELPSSAFRR